jgi:hypothetical protein
MFFRSHEIMPMVPPTSTRRKRTDQPHLFLRPPDRIAWEQLPPASRDEVRKLFVQIFVARGASQGPAGKEEADHE